MSRFQTFQDLFKRYRRPGDFVFAAAFFVFALFLMVSIPWQTTWVKRTALTAQPAFWPVVAVGLMVVFGGLHLIGSLVSERIPGRRAEVFFWFRSVEFAFWFLAYVMIVPWIGYLIGSVVFCVALTLRAGYHSWRWCVVAALMAVAIVVVFKALLHVSIPAGEIYGMLPPGKFRIFMMSYF